MSKFQLTLAILKPDVSHMSYSVYKIREMLLNSGFCAVASKEMCMSRSMAEDFYSEHASKFFYNRLVTYMTSGPIFVHVLGRENAIKEWRSLMGPTKVFKTRFEHPETIRGMLGLTDTRNTSHGSDSEENARKEIEFFFPDFDWEKYKEEEHFYKSGQTRLDFVKFLHTPLRLNNVPKE